MDEQGSGRVDALNAINADLVVRGDLNYGLFRDGLLDGMRTIEIENIGDQGVALTISATDGRNERGETIDSSVIIFSVPPILLGE